MYELVDRPVGSLCRSGRFIIWATRGWQQARQRGTCPPMALQRAFASIDALPVLGDFHIAMTLLTSAGQFQLDQRSMNEPLIGDTEAVLLTLWADVAEGKTEKVSETLSLLVTEGLISPLSAVMTTILQRMEACGLETATVGRAI